MTTLLRAGRFLIASALLGASASMVSCGSAAPPPPSAPSALSAKPLPDFSRPAIDGRKVDTEALRGQVVVIKFFAKYCEPCKRTLPATQSLHTAMSDVSFIGVAIDEYQSDVQEMVDRYKLTFPVVHDRGTVLAGRYRVSDMPVTFVADPKGVVRWVGAEDVTEESLRSAIEAAKE